MDHLAIAGGSVDALPQQAFRLAYFIVRDRPLAIRILIRALNKLSARCKQEDKRVYWRDKYLKRWVTKISRIDSDTLQWLIYFEAEPYEKMLEQNGTVTIEDLVVRYVKSLIQMTTGMSSFYVAIGMHRLLHDYSTSNIQRMYEIVTERYVGADEYRRVKRSLMNKLTLRFGALLRTVTLAHGEVRFERLEDQTPWTDLVQRSLRMFVPWSTMGHCLVPAGFGQTSLGLPSMLSGVGSHRLNLDQIETNRCHAFIDPWCYGRLAEGLGFDPADKKVALPKFLLGSGQGPDADSTRHPEPANLTQREIETIQKSLAAEAGRRGDVRPHELRLIVDGRERAQFALGQQSQIAVPLAEDARLVEVWTHDQEGDLLIGTHRLDYSSSGRLAPSKAIVVTGGVTLSLVVNGGNASEPASLALVDHLFQEPHFFQRRFFVFRAFRYAALALLCVAVGWTLSAVKYRHDLLLQRARLVPQFNESADARSHLQLGTPQAEANVTVKQELTPYDAYVRGGSIAHPPNILLPASATLVRLDLPVPVTVNGPFLAALRRFSQPGDVMTERLATNGDPHPYVTFDVPAALLSDNTDYLIELRAISSARAQQSVHTFIFHIAKPTP
jgi:hypothetical protein